MKQYDDYTNEMLCAAIQAGDDYARGILIERNRRWIGSLADHSYKILGMSAFATSAALDDLIQAGNMALLRAAKRYDPDKVPIFLAFAKKAILNAMRSEAKREYTESPLRLLESEKVRAVLRLDDSYDADTDSSLSECIPDEQELTPEEWHERKENARSLWEALKVLNPHDREFIMLRYQLGNRNGSTELHKGILPLKEAAKLAHISEGRAKRIEQEALDFLKRHIEERREPKTAASPNLSQEARSAAEKLCDVLRNYAVHNALHVPSLPFVACSATHSETITGTADLTVTTMIPSMGEQVKRSAYVPTWIISDESRDELRIHIRFHSHRAHATEALLRLRIDTIVRDCGTSDDIKTAPDLTEWLWCLASELWISNETENEVNNSLSARRAFVRDIVDAVLDHHRHLGG